MGLIMQFMAKGKKYSIIVLLIFIFYIIYLYYDYKLYEGPGYFATESHKDISKFKNVEGLIIGGSNSLYGLSAEQLSKKTNWRFYNLSIMYEGNTSDNYFNYIKKITNDSTRNKIKVILFSTINIYSNLIRHELKYDLNGKEKYIIEPRIKILSFIKNIFIKPPNSSIFEITCSKFYGDLLFKGISNSFNPKDYYFKYPPIHEILNLIICEKNRYSKLFPNSIFIIIAPTIYNKEISIQNSYIHELNLELKKRNITLIYQQPFTNTSLMSDFFCHPNEIGRTIRTNQLIDSLRKVTHLLTK